MYFATLRALIGDASTNLVMHVLVYLGEVFPFLVSSFFVFCSLGIKEIIFILKINFWNYHEILPETGFCGIVRSQCKNLFSPCIISQ